MLLNFFPVPKMLNMHAAGLALSDTHLRFVDFTEKRGHFSLGTNFEVPLPPGTIEFGAVKNTRALVDVLKSIQTKVDTFYVNISLPEEKAFLFRTKINSTENEEDFRAAVEFQIQEQVPLPSKEVVFDYMTLSEAKEGKEDVVVSVLSNSVVSLFVKSLKEAGFMPLSIEIESQAVADAVIARGDSNAYIVVNIGTRRTGLSIVDDGVVQFTSTLVVEKEKIIEQVKANSIGGSSLKKEIEKLRMYWESNRDERYENTKPIEKVILCGDCGDENFFLDDLSSHLRFDVELANVWTNIFSLESYVPDISFGDSLKYAEAIGLALPNKEKYLS